MVSPAVPSETVKPAPMEVSSPIGRISVVTIAKMPAVTANTAGQPEEGETSRPVAGEVAVRIGSVLWSEERGRVTANRRRGRRAGGFPTPTWVMSLSRDPPARTSGVHAGAAGPRPLRGRDEVVE